MKRVVQTFDEATELMVTTTKEYTVDVPVWAGALLLLCFLLMGGAIVAAVLMG